MIRCMYVIEHFLGDKFMKNSMMDLGILTMEYGVKDYMMEQFHH